MKTVALESGGYLTEIKVGNASLFYQDDNRLISRKKCLEMARMVKKTLLKNKK